MSTATLKLDPVMVVPRHPRSPVVLGQESILAPKTELVISIDTDDPVRARDLHLRQLLAENRAGELASNIADLTLERAERFSGSSLAWSQAGFALLVSGQYERAVTAFERSLAIEPKLRRGRIGLARARFELSETLAAIAELRALLLEAPEDTEVAVSLAVVLAENGQPSEALSTVESVPGSSTSAAFLAVRGALRLAEGRYPDAVSDLRKAARIKPDWVHVRNSLGLAELKAGNVKGAEQRFREASRVAPFYLDAFLNLLRVLMLKGRFEETLREVRNRYEPAAAPASVGRIAGNAAFEMTSWREALSWWVCSLEKTRDEWMRARLENDIGCAYARLGDHAKAGEFFERSVHTHVSDLATVNRARAFLSQGKGLLSVAWLSAAPVPEDGESYERRKTFAQSLFYARLFSQALAAARELIRIPNADADAYALLTSLLADHEGDTRSAVQYAEEGLRRYPGTSVLLNNLAYSLLQDGQLERAAEVLNSQDVQGSTQEPALRATMGLLALKRGDVAAGVALYEQALGLAATSAMRAKIKAKRDLEVGRALLTLGGSVTEAAALLQRAAEGGEAAAPYPQHAISELRRLRA